MANLMTQPGETRGYTAADHVRALNEHAGRKLFDRVVMNSKPISSAMRKRYLVEEAEPVAIDLHEIRSLCVDPICANLLDENRVARHDSNRLAQLLLDLAAQHSGH